MIRLFAAIEVPPEIGEGLSPLMTGVPGARWRPQEALHVTLRFFGEIQESLAADLDLELERAPIGPFELSIGGLGSFGEAHRVDTLWAGLEPSEPLMRLQKRCESAARRAGLKPDTRTYRPHVTLAYLKGAPAAKVADWMAEHNLVRSEPWRVERFALFSSWLSPEGSRYVLEREYPLTP
jgi:2'-5' RNA ligase